MAQAHGIGQQCVRLALLGSTGQLEPEQEKGTLELRLGQRSALAVSVCWAKRRMLMARLRRLVMALGAAPVLTLDQPPS